MKTDELKYRLERLGVTGLSQRKLNFTEVRRMSADELHWHETHNQANLDAAINNKGNAAIIEQAENQSRWYGILRRHQRRLKGDILTPDTPEDDDVLLDELFKKFFASHPIAETGEGGERNGFILTQFLYDNNMSLSQASFDSAWETLKGDLVPSSAELERRAEMKLGAAEYAQKHGVVPYSDARYYDVGSGTIKERGVTEHVLARWQRVIATFVEQTPRYKPTEKNKNAMLAFLRERPIDLTNLQAAFTALSAEGKLELQDSPEDVARKAGGQVVIQHDLGGRAPGYPQTNAMPAPRRRRKLSEVIAGTDSKTYLERLRTDENFRRAVDGGGDVEIEVN